MIRSLPVFFVALWLAQNPAQPASGTGFLVGRVVEAQSGAPLTGAVVALSGPVPVRRVIVDGEGRFAFAELPAGDFTLAVTRSGFLPGASGKRRPDGAGRPVTLRAGEHRTDVTIPMWRFASISGTVTDDAGDAVVGARVQVLKRSVLAGHWRLVNTGLTGTADERGNYRVFGLGPGEYAAVITSLIGAIPASLIPVAISSRDAEPATRQAILRAAQMNGSAGYLNDITQGFPETHIGDMLLQGSPLTVGPTGSDGSVVRIYPTIWYPSAALPAQAAVIKIDAGDARTGIDLRMTLTPTLRVSGRASGPDGPSAYLALRLVPAALDDVSAEVTSSLSLSFTAATTVTNGDGAFTFIGVPAGQYVIRALTSPPATSPEGSPATPANDSTLWATTPVAVGDADVSGVSVTLQAGLRVTGRVVFEGASPKPADAALRAMRVALDPADGRSVTTSKSAYRGQVDPDGTFHTIGLLPGRYVLDVDVVPRGWTVKSAVVSGRDICDSPLTLDSNDVSGLVLTFTDHPSGISGAVHDGQGRPDGAADVFVFPAEGPWTDLGPNPRRLREVATSAGGAFAVSSLPPGAYNVVAIVDDDVPSDWPAPEVIERLGRAGTRVVVGDGQSPRVDLITSRIR